LENVSSSSSESTHLATPYRIIFCDRVTVLLFKANLSFSSRWLVLWLLQIFFETGQS
jgi:hypothetical protein